MSRSKGTRTKNDERRKSFWTYKMKSFSNFRTYTFPLSTLLFPVKNAKHHGVIFRVPPESPQISLRSLTQTSAIIQWKPIVLHNAFLRGIDVYRNLTKLSMSVAPTATSVKLSGLDVNHEYDAHIVLRTSAGTYKSNTLSFRTHTMENLTGISVSFGALSVSCFRIIIFSILHAFYFDTH
jgi:hypothetical protein